MQRVNFTLLVLLVFSILFGCTKANLNYTQNGNWVSRAGFGGTTGIAVGYAASFVIGNNAYVGTGVNPQFPSNRQVAMFRYTPSPLAANAPESVYDTVAGVWTAIANFPGAPRSNAVGFSVAGLGYLGTGLGNDGVTTYADFWSYNPGSDSWTEIDSLSDALGNHPRFDAAAFGFDTAGYVLTGTDGFNYFNDVWKFSPATGQWTRQPNMPGNTRSGAVTWIYHNQGYLLTGYTPGIKWASGNLAFDFWRFNPNSFDSTIAWIRLRDIFNTSAGTYDDGYTNIVRKNGAAFVILGTINGDKGYITLGSNASTSVNFTWEYDFASDTWDEKAPYKGTSRTGPVGFTLLNRAFVCTGLNTGSQAAYSDCYEFFPSQVYNPND
jgi:N-acetylneuraminic acid mutarotase